MQREMPADGKWMLLQSCRLIAKKGVDDTLRAFASIVKIWPKAQLIIAGDGPLRGDLEKLASELGISAQVRFVGFLNQQQLRDEVYRSHLFVHPSRTSLDGNREGIPNSMLEAMASGLPVIATRHGGIPEAVTDGESGLLVAENDSAGLAAAMSRMISDAALASHLAEGGRRAVEDRFDRVKNIRGLEACYVELIASDRSAGSGGGL